MGDKIVTPEVDQAFREVNGKATSEMEALKGWEKDGVVLSATKVVSGPCGEPKALPSAWMDQEGLHLVLTKWHVWQVAWGLLDGIILALIAMVLYILLTQQRGEQQ